MLEKNRGELDTSDKENSEGVGCKETGLSSPLPFSRASQSRPYARVLVLRHLCLKKFRQAVNRSYSDLSLFFFSGKRRVKAMGGRSDSNVSNKEQGVKVKLEHVNPLTPRSDQHMNFPYNFNTLSSRQVMRIKKINN